MPWDSSLPYIIFVIIVVVAIIIVIVLATTSSPTPPPISSQSSPQSTSSEPSRSPVSSPPSLITPSQRVPLSTPPADAIFTVSKNAAAPTASKDKIPATSRDKMYLYLLDTVWRGYNHVNGNMNRGGLYYTNMTRLDPHNIMIFIVIGWPSLSLADGVRHNCQINASILMSSSLDCKEDAITLGSFKVTFVDFISDSPEAPNGASEKTPEAQNGASDTVPNEIKDMISTIVSRIEASPPITMHIPGICSFLTSPLSMQGSLHSGNNFTSTREIMESKDASICLNMCRDTASCAASSLVSGRCTHYSYTVDGKIPFIPQIIAGGPLAGYVHSKWFFNSKGFLPPSDKSILCVTSDGITIDFSYDGSNGIISSPQGYLTVLPDNRVVFQRDIHPIRSQGWSISSQYNLPSILSVTNSDAVHQSACTIEYNNDTLPLFGGLQLGEKMVLRTDGHRSPMTIYVKSN